ncbi:MAG TPA: VCBS repeat-containing protein, partial [Bryobacteraceae bacterium]|nr:VCBS repeat-containing protein [Bryobacteraceae bacterium]
MKERLIFRLAFILALVASGVPSASSASTPTFSDRHEYDAPACWEPAGPVLAVADTNGDGIPDLICSGISVLFGNGDGTFRPGPASQVFFGANNPTPVDLNGDGKIDLVVTAGASVVGPYGIAVTFGNGDGTFQ